MGRFDDRWGEHHRATIARAVLDDGLNLREALRRAKAGQLDGAEAFDMLAAQPGDMSRRRNSGPKSIS
jgi:hypothetical protein